MRWVNGLLSAAPLWLSWLHTSHGSIPKKASVIRRQPNQQPDQSGEFVYRGDLRSDEEIRNAGGFRPQGRDWYQFESSYSISRHYHAGPNGCGLDDFEEAGFVYRTAYVSVARDRATAETYGDWLYEIRATPNILDDEDRYPEGEVFALGGVQWRQIRRWVQMSNDTAIGNRVNEAAWVDNPDYDADLYERSEYAANCRVSTDFPPELEDGQALDDDDVPDPAYQAAMYFMDTEVMYALVGDFPTFQPEPEPSDSEDDSADEESARQLQHYANMSPQQADSLLPNGNQILHQLLDEASCSSAHHFSFHSKRSDLDIEPRTSGEEERAKQDNCCKLATRIRKKISNSHKKTRKSHKKFRKIPLVYICANDAFHPPCTHIEAPPRKCVDLPSDWNDMVSALRPGRTAGDCHFYKYRPSIFHWSIQLHECSQQKARARKIEADEYSDYKCAGPQFQASYPGVDIWKDPKIHGLNDQLSSFRCDGLRSLILTRRCEHFDGLTVWLKIGDAWTSGTWSRISYTFHIQSLIRAANAPSAGACLESKIPLEAAYGSHTVPISRVNRFTIWDSVSQDTSSDNWLFGGDKWLIQGFRIDAKCAGSSKILVFEKSALNREVSHEPNHLERPTSVYSTWINPGDWIDPGEVLPHCVGSTR